jgi:hypothetical protein
MFMSDRESSLRLQIEVGAEFNQSDFVHVASKQHVVVLNAHVWVANILTHFVLLKVEIFNDPLLVQLDELVLVFPVDPVLTEVGYGQGVVLCTFPSNEEILVVVVEHGLEVELLAAELKLELIGSFSA